MKKKVLLGVFVIILLSGCSNDQKGNVLTCVNVDEIALIDSEYKINYNKSWDKIEKLTATMTVDVSDYSKEELEELTTGITEECEEVESIAESCVVNKEKDKLVLKIVGPIEMIDENPIVTSDSNVEEVKTYFENEGLTCKKSN